MTTATATPKKLKDGSWGARVSGSVAAGDEITITTRSGKSWQARVDRVLWSGDGITLVSTSRQVQARPAYAETRDVYGARHAHAYYGVSNADGSGCRRCCRTTTRTAQIWEECASCGAEPIYA